MGTPRPSRPCSRRRGTPTGRIFLGDTVLSGPQPNETMALLRGIDGILIAGNHDAEMMEPERFESWPAPWLAYTQWIVDTLESPGWELLRSLAPEGEYEIGGLRLFLHHGVLPDEPRQALPDTADERLIALARGTDCPLVLFGHSHIQFRRTIDGQEFVNPGSVGQPRSSSATATGLDRKPRRNEKTRSPVDAST